MFGVLAHMGRYNLAMTTRAKWLLFAPLGLSLIGLGLSVTLEAARLKTVGEPWFWLGTLGLVIVNAGVAVFGDAVKCRVLVELEEARKH